MWSYEPSNGHWIFQAGTTAKITNTVFSTGVWTKPIGVPSSTDYPEPRKTFTGVAMDSGDNIISYGKWCIDVFSTTDLTWTRLKDYTGMVRGPKYASSTNYYPGARSFALISLTKNDTLVVHGGRILNGGSYSDTWTAEARCPAGQSCVNSGILSTCGVAPSCSIGAFGRLVLRVL